MDCRFYYSIEMNPSLYDLWIVFDNYKAYSKEKEYENSLILQSKVKFYL